MYRYSGYNRTDQQGTSVLNRNFFKRATEYCTAKDGESRRMDFAGKTGRRFSVEGEVSSNILEEQSRCDLRNIKIIDTNNKSTSKKQDFHLTVRVFFCLVIVIQT